MDFVVIPLNNSSKLYDPECNKENDTIFELSYPLQAIANKSVSWIVICLGFPLSLLAIYSLYSMVRENHAAPVYVINLLISDLIQICCLVFSVSENCRSKLIYVSKRIYCIGVLASVGFMLCVALERYVVVAWPLWYRVKRSIKFSVLVSVLVWVLCIIEISTVLLVSDFKPIFHSIFFLLPFPVLIFCLAGTLKSLSSAISVPPKEKRRILASLVLVLLNYTLLFLPWVISLLSHRHSCSFCFSFLQFSPLADLVLYVFMKKGAVDKLLASLCCCRMTGEKQQSHETTTNEKTTEEVSSV